MSEQVVSDHSDQPEATPPFTIPQVLESAGLDQEPVNKPYAPRIPCDIPGCKSRITERGKKRHMTQSHPDVKPKGKPGRKPGSLNKPKPPSLSLMWNDPNDPDHILLVDQDNKVWEARPLWSK